jgi:hypothetical protein
MLIILFIFFSVILVQKNDEQIVFTGNFWLHSYHFFPYDLSIHAVLSGVKEFIIVIDIIDGA